MTVESITATQHSLLIIINPRALYGVGGKKSTKFDHCACLVCRKDFDFTGLWIWQLQKEVKGDSCWPGLETQSPTAFIDKTRFTTDYERAPFYKRKDSTFHGKKAHTTSKNQLKTEEDIVGYYIEIK